MGSAIVAIPARHASDAGDVSVGQVSNYTIASGNRQCSALEAENSTYALEYVTKSTCSEPVPYNTFERFSFMLRYYRSYPS